MHRPQLHSRTYVGALSLAGLAGTVLAVNGCSGEPPDETETEAAASDGTTTPISQLPFIDATTNPQLLGELLAKPTELGETTALHVRLPPPQNKELANSLVRIIGPVDSPQMLFRSDTLAKLGLIAKSPGKDFFTAFATLSPDQLEILKKNQDQIASGVFGKPTNESVRVRRPLRGRAHDQPVRSIRRGSCLAAASARSTPARSGRCRRCRPGDNRCSSPPRRSSRIPPGRGIRAPARAPRAGSGRSLTSCARWRMARGRPPRPSSPTGSRSGSITTPSTAISSPRARGCSPR